MNCLNVGNLLPMVLRKASFTDLWPERFVGGDYHCILGMDFKRVYT